MGAALRRKLTAGHGRDVMRMPKMMLAARYRTSCVVVLQDTSTSTSTVDINSFFRLKQTRAAVPVRVQVTYRS
eukprot:scaffold102859_cov19-Prasinocladus_malaysianus.AAC.1